MMDLIILTTIIYTWGIEFPYDRGRKRKDRFLNRIKNWITTKVTGGMLWIRRRFDTKRRRSRSTTKTRSRYCRRFYRSSRRASSGFESTRQAQFCVKKGLALGLILTSLAGTTTAANSPKFDTDSYQIALDSATSCYMTPVRSDLDPKTIKRINQLVRGAHTSELAKVSGTSKFAFADDRGVAFSLAVPDTVLCPTLPFRIFSPQKFAQELRRQFPGSRAFCLTDHKKSTLYWTVAGQNYVKSIHHDPVSNIPLFRSLPGYKNYAKFSLLVNEGDIDHQLIALDTHLIPPDDDDEDQVRKASTLRPPEAREQRPETPTNTDTNLPNAPVPIEFYDESIPVLTESPDRLVSTTKMALQVGPHIVQQIARHGQTRNSTVGVSNVPDPDVPVLHLREADEATVEDKGAAWQDQI